MKIRYRIGKGLTADEGKLSRPRTVRRTMFRLRVRALFERGPYFLGKRGAPKSNRVKFGDAMRRMRRRLIEGEVGNVYHLYTGENEWRVRIIALPTVELPTEAADWDSRMGPIYEQVMAEFGPLGIEWWGTTVPRPASHNPNIPSQHSWPGQATDFGVVPKRGSVKELGDRVAAFIRERGDDVLIVWWTTAHFDHLHVELKPNRTGEPPTDWR